MVKSAELSQKELKIKNLKFRIFPSDEWKEKFRRDSDAWRWYYNFVVDLHRKKKFKNNTSYISIREKMKKYGYEYSSENKERKIIKNTTSDFFCPSWMEKTLHNRVTRGAIRKFAGNLKTALSNKKNGNIDHFQMNFRSKRRGEYLSFEDGAFEKIYKTCKAYYGYRTGNRERVTLKPEEVAKEIG